MRWMALPGWPWLVRTPKVRMIDCIREDCSHHLVHPEGEHMLVDISEATQRARREADRQGVTVVVDHVIDY